ncbi:MAG: DUF6456 domain-containing protein, partial [Pseudomonadota bacterium]
MSGDPIARLSRSGARGAILGARHVEAAERLRRDFLNALRGPQITSRYAPRLEARGRSAAAGDGGPGAEARRRLDGALFAVGEDARTALVRVVLEERGLEDLEAEQGWPRRSGKIVASASSAILTT